MRSAAVEGKPERISESECIDLRLGGCADERIIRRNIIGTSVHVNAQNISHQVRIIILPVPSDIRRIPIGNMSVAYIILIPTITNGYIQKTIRTECQCAPIMI